jgi:predicted kinase
VPDRTEDRTRIQAAARAAGVCFDGLWLEADPDLLRSRLDTRDPGASDADADVLAKQLARVTTVVGWQTVYTTSSLADSLNAALLQLHETTGQY